MVTSDDLIRYNLGTELLSCSLESLRGFNFFVHQHGRLIRCKLIVRTAPYLNTKVYNDVYSHFTFIQYMIILIYIVITHENNCWWKYFLCILNSTLNEEKSDLFLFFLDYSPNLQTNLKEKWKKGNKSEEIHLLKRFLKIAFLTITIRNFIS